MIDLWEFYKDTDDRWRWRRTAPNGNIVGAATQGYANRIDCEANATRNGWSKEHAEIKSKAFELFAKHGFKDGDEFVDWLEAEKLAGKFGEDDYTTPVSRLRRSRHTKRVLRSVVVILGVIVVILLINIFSENPKMELSDKSISDQRVMMLVLDPVSNEKLAIFSDAHFSSDKAALSQDAKDILDLDMLTMKDNSQTNVRVAGYTSTPGSGEVNQGVSKERAGTVKDYLIKKGIAPERITVFGYGRTRSSLYEVEPGNFISKEENDNLQVLFEVVVIYKI
jgi:flagellar motor protein MotB